jgi:histidine triad (HIT) family protein
MSSCLFCKITNKEIPAKIIYEDNTMVAFHDISPKADIHFLIIPKIHITSMLDLKEKHKELMGSIMLRANALATEFDLEGYKVQINTGIKGGQEVFHLHVHVFGNK